MSCKCYLQLKNWIARPVAKHLFFHSEFGFVFCEQCHLHNIFNNESSIHLHQPLDANSWPKFWNNKNIQCLKTFKFLKKHQNKWETHVFWQQLFFHPHKCLFQGMDSSTTSLLARPIPLNHMKWQLEISQPIFAWISSQWL